MSGFKKTIILSLMIIAILFVAVGCGGNTNSNTTGNAVTALDDGNDEISLDEGEQRKQYDNERFKEADQFVLQFMADQYEADKEGIMSALAKGSDAYNHFMEDPDERIDTYSPVVWTDEPSFEEDAHYYQFTRYSSMFDETGKLYYTFLYDFDRTEYTTASGFDRIEVVLDENGEWKVSDIHVNAPDELVTLSSFLVTEKTAGSRETDE